MGFKNKRFRKKKLKKALYKLKAVLEKCLEKARKEQVKSDFLVPYMIQFLFSRKYSLRAILKVGSFKNILLNQKIETLKLLQRKYKKKYLIKKSTLKVNSKKFKYKD